MQTHTIKPFPVVLFDGTYWNGFLGWLRECALASEFISEEDFNLLRVCEDAEEVVEAVRMWYENQELAGRKGI